MCSILVSILFSGNWIFINSDMKLQFDESLNVLNKHVIYMIFFLFISNDYKRYKNVKKIISYVLLSLLMNK